MREIKFRAWDNKEKKWLLGYEYPNLGGFSMTGEVMLFEEWSRVVNRFILQQYDRKPEDLILMQFTGLHENAFEETEKNREIYNGDIIEFTGGERLSVEWNDDTCQWQYSDGSLLNDGERYGSHRIIIGNIYENPELLKSNTHEKNK